MDGDLVKALLALDAASPEDLARALDASVSRGVPLVRALLESRAASEATLSRVLARGDAPVVQRVVPMMDLVMQLPPGICERLHAVPVRTDPTTGTVDVVVADASDTHAAAEMAFHLRAPVRVLRAPLLALEDGLRRVLGIASRPPSGAVAPPSPPVAPAPTTERSQPRARLVVEVDDDPSHPPPPLRSAVSVPTPGPRRTRDTPPWGTDIRKVVGSEPPKSATGSEIPIPLTRKTFTAVSGGTQRPPPLRDPSISPLGEGYPVDLDVLRAAVEVGTVEALAIPAAPRVPAAEVEEPAPSTERDAPGLGALLATLQSTRDAVRDATSRDDILARLLEGAERVAARVAVFVVRRGGYLGWTCNAAFAKPADLQALLLPLDAGNVLDRAVQEGSYLGPVPEGDPDRPLRALVGRTSPDVAVIAVRVQGRAVALVVADDLVDTMVATRHLDDLAAAAGDAFARLLRHAK